MAVFEQVPAVTVYEMVTPPWAIPVTTPAPFTVAFVGSLEVHVPPGVAFVRVIVLPAQTFVGPAMADTKGVGLTVIMALPETVPAHPPGLASVTDVTR